MEKYPTSKYPPEKSRYWSRPENIVALEVPYMGRPHTADSETLNPQKRWEQHRFITEYGPGCPAKCIYCNQQAFEIDKETGKKKTPYISLMVDAGISLNTRLMSAGEIVSSLSVEQLIEELIQFHGYFPQSSLMIENFNDPGVDWPKTISLIKELIRIKHQGPIIFLTKFGISELMAKALAELKKNGAKIIAGVTYSGLPEAIEPIGSQARLLGLKRFKESGIPTIVSMRPIIQGINDDDNSLRYILEQAGHLADVITAGGLFVYDDFTHKAFSQAGYLLDEEFYPKNGYNSAKIIEDGLKSKLRKLAKKIGMKTPVMDHFSCSTALLMSRVYEEKFSDRMARWANPYGKLQKDCDHCPADQKAICFNKSQESVQDVIDKAKEMASRLGYPNIVIEPSTQIPGLLIVKNGLLAINELFAIESFCGWDVNNLPTREVLMEEVYNIIGVELFLDLDKYLIRVKMINQDWFIYTKGLSSRQQDLAVKHLRGKLRCRIQLINEI